ncbi:MAG: polysaccharide biosynthesis C-terminal domain-containing protein [Chitinophagales bacterium]
MWYGVSNIAARLLTYLLTPYFTYILTGYNGTVVYGKYRYIYALFPIMNVLYTYGMETAFFRFSTTEDKQKLYRTQITAMVVSTFFFTLLLYLFRTPVASFAKIEDHIEYVGWCAVIIGLDALSALPYARLRKENRPRKYAFTKVIGIVVFVVTIVFLFSFGGKIAANNPGGIFGGWYRHNTGVGFILFANMLQAAVTLMLLFSELKDYRPAFDWVLFKKIFKYGYPILIAGFAGVINDSLNRVMFEHLYPATDKESLRQLGFYSAALSLAVLINLVIQAFKLAAEPFFFSISQKEDAKHTYARVMKWFIILLTVMFLNVMLYLDVWKYFVGKEYQQAMGIVPLLLLSYIFLGVYYNLTVWYKLIDKTHYGTYIMVIGALVTIIFNWLLIPVWGYYACAWGTVLCYGIMMCLSYYWGQKYYPIPYDVPKLAKYFGLMLLLFFINYGISKVVASAILHICIGTVLFAAYLYYIYTQEKEELKRFPVIGKR